MSDTTTGQEFDAARYAGRTPGPWGAYDDEVRSGDDLLAEIGLGIRGDEGRANIRLMGDADRLLSEVSRLRSELASLRSLHAEHLKASAEFRGEALRRATERRVEYERVCEERDAMFAVLAEDVPDPHQAEGHSWIARDSAGWVAVETTREGCMERIVARGRAKMSGEGQSS